MIGQAGPTFRRAALAGMAAAAVSGAPSTAWALLTGEDPLAAARAAGTVVPGRGRRPGLAAGIGAHVVVSALWTGAFVAVSRHVRLGPSTGALGGAVVAAVDLGLVAPRRYPAVAALEAGPQVADHLLFGAVLGWGLHRPDRPAETGGAAGTGGAAAGPVRRQCRRASATR